MQKILGNILILSRPLKSSSNLIRVITRFSYAGDLNSFKWVKSAMKDNYDHPKLLYPKLDLGTNKPFMIDIYYSSINFKDVMVASGRVPLNAYPLGEFEIQTSHARRVSMRMFGKHCSLTQSKPFNNYNY